MNFEKARFNMVEQQIRPWDVLDFDILDVLGEIPREDFVTEAQQPYAYSDKTLPLPNGGNMLEPKIVARMIQAIGQSIGSRHRLGLCHRSIGKNGRRSHYGRH